MAKKKKGKKGGKKAEKGPEIRTTMAILESRDKMLCPRMGDNYTRVMEVGVILEDVCSRTLVKAGLKNDTSVILCGMKLSLLPNFFDLSANLRGLQDVNLARNELFNGAQVFGVLSQLKKLRRLNLSNNCLNGRLHDSMCDLTELEVLHLDNNQLTMFPGRTHLWTKLHTLTFADNAVQELPQEAAHWKSLQYINMKSNRIVELPGAALQSWTLVERLSASFNKLKALPETISFCQKLVELDLCNNLLEGVPAELAMCRDLQILNLACNKIQELPVELFQSLAMLKDLQLYKNKISTLPPEVGNLRALSRLSLSSNNLKALPEEIGACINLKELYINNNAKFAVIPGTAGHLRSLQELSARKCPALKQLPNTLADMESLRELDVRAAKKQVCKIAPDLSDSLRAQNCIVRGGVVKKAKGGKGKK